MKQKIGESTIYLPRNFRWTPIVMKMSEPGKTGIFLITCQYLLVSSRISHENRTRSILGSRSGKDETYWIRSLIE